MTCSETTKEWRYVDAETGEVKHTAKTIQHYGFDHQAAYGPGWVLDREVCTEINGRPFDGPAYAGEKSSD